MTLDAFKKATDLNIIIDKMFENENSVPEFAKKSERNAMDRIEAYTSKVTKRYGVELQELVEENSGELLDGICGISRTYYKNGMKAGAVLLLQLLEF